MAVTSTDDAGVDVPGVLHTQVRVGVSVAAVIRRGDGRVVCIRRRDNGAWQIPGGVLERGETFHQALRREVREETGMSVEPERLTGIYLNLPLGVVALVFLCREGHTEDLAEAEPLTETEEATAVEWLTVEEVVRRSTPAFAVRVTDALAGRQEPVLRHHDGVRLLGVESGALDGVGEGASAEAGPGVRSWSTAANPRGWSEDPPRST
ncbi:NUDIX hydrolase [Frankia sp. CcI49]|uniref:NUDIX hydrolase n=1 Tax=Frankia sp. CcI49 TaxID=1745382 RepID=UPI0026D0445A